MKYFKLDLSQLEHIPQSYVKNRVVSAGKRQGLFSNFFIGNDADTNTKVLCYVPSEVIEGCVITFRGVCIGKVFESSAPLKCFYHIHKKSDYERLIRDLVINQHIDKGGVL